MVCPHAAATIAAVLDEMQTHLQGSLAVQRVDDALTELGQLVARLDELQDRVGELEDALRPFAGVMFVSAALDGEVWEFPVQVGHLRRAREVLYGRPRLG